MRQRTIRLVELAAILLAAGGAFEVGVAMRRLLVGLILCGLTVVIVGLAMMAVERWRTRPSKDL